MQALRAIILLVFSSILFFTSCSIWEDRYSDEDIIDYFNKYNQDVSIGYYKVKGRKMRYMSLGHDSLPTVLLIHGAPSSMSVFNQLISESNILDHANVYAVDRPGYGYSGFGHSETSIKRQAAMIAPILDSIDRRGGPVVVMGVSYGGPIASKIAMDYPELVDGLILGAPAIAPGEEKTFTISHLMVHNATSWLFPTILRVATEEKFSHREELEKMLFDWECLDKPIIYIQGESDEIVYTTNAQFIEKKARRAPFLKILMIPNQPHFLAIPQKKLLAESIIEMIGLLNEPKGFFESETKKVDYEDRADRASIVK